ncbi:MAG: alanine racemase [Deltaproteobacteria bacterium]|jgi:alanine racemase|nr:alanine racemase [Deltaproteobacteria bacterium]
MQAPPLPRPGTLDYNLAEVDLDALRHNYAALADFAGDRPLMAVVKGDAYGHGLAESAAALCEAGATRFGVLDAREGADLRKSGKVKGEIWVLAGLTSDLQISAAVRADLSAFVYSTEQLLGIASAAAKETRRIKVFLKLDTGMSRLGVPWNMADDFLSLAAENPHLEVQGLATHLATLGNAPATGQLSRFWAARGLAESIFRRPLALSALSGGGMLAHPDFPDGLSRPGLLLYGAVPALSPGPRNRLPPPWNPSASIAPPLLESQELALPEASLACAAALRPVMRVTSRVIQVKTVRRGETVSYEGIYKAQKNLRVAVLPFGYVHGLQTSRSGKCAALIRGKIVPQIGRVCMNLSVYDADSIPLVQAGDEAVLLGCQGDLRIGPEGAGGEGLSPYETLCCLGRLNARRYSGRR